MSFVHSKSSYISVDGTDVSQYVDSVDHGRTVDTAEVSALGDSDRAFIAGLEDGSFSLSGHWDSTEDATLAGTFDGATVTVIYGPAGSTAGNVKYQATCLVTAYNISSSVGDRVTWSASFQRTGALTRTTF